MVHSPQDFMEEGAPIADLLKIINKSFYITYEFDKHDYSGTGCYVLQNDDIKPACRERWGIDLTKVNNYNWSWGNDVTAIQNHALYHIVNNSTENRERLQQFFDEKEEGYQPDKAIKNITNGWRDEFALNDPLDGDSADRMKIAEWRITMAYYAVYKATSALIRSKFASKKEGGSDHAGMWSYHMKYFMNELGTSLYAYPFMFFPRDTGAHSSKWFDWTVPYPVQEEYKDEQTVKMQGYAKERLSFIHSNALDIWGNNKLFVTFYDLLLELRHWANYQEGGIFSRLYGPGYRKYIDEALRIITFIGMTIAEVGLIHSLGIDTIHEVYRDYKTSCEEGIEQGIQLVQRRMNVYEQAFV